MAMIFHHEFNLALPWLGRRVNISRGVEQDHDFVPSSWESFAVSLSTRYFLSRLRHAEGKIRLWLFWRRTGRACTGGIALLDRARSRNSPNQRARQGCCPPAGRSDPVSPPPLPRLMRSALWAEVACCFAWFLMSADVMAWVAAALANDCKGRGNRETGGTLAPPPAVGDTVRGGAGKAHFSYTDESRVYSRTYSSSWATIYTASLIPVEFTGSSLRSVAAAYRSQVAGRPGLP